MFTRHEYFKTLTTEEKKAVALVAKGNKLMKRLILGFDFNKKSIYEFRLENEVVNMTIWDFSVPFFRIKRRGLYYDQFEFFCKRAPSQYKKIIEPPKNRTGYIVQWFNYMEDAAILDAEKAIKKVYFNPKKRLKLLQEPYFI